jgi:hypothetical protein
MSKVNFNAVILISIAGLVMALCVYNYLTMNEAFRNNNTSPVNTPPPFPDMGANLWKREFDKGMNYYVMKHGYLNPNVSYKPRYTLSGNFVYEEPEPLIN